MAQGLHAVSVGGESRTWDGPPRGEAGLEAIPGSPVARGLTATRPGTPTAKQEGRAGKQSYGGSAARPLAACSRRALTQVQITQDCPRSTLLSGRRLSHKSVSPLW